MNKKYRYFLEQIQKKNNYINIIDENNSFNGNKIKNIIITATKIFCKKNIYLEIGVFRGNTLINNAINNKKSYCYGVDNFSLFNQSKKNELYVKEKISENKLTNIKIINNDFEYAIKLIKKKIGVLFIDGAHDYRSQLISLLTYKKKLANDCIIIIDDSNYFHVRKANQDFMDINNDFSLIFQKYTDRHIANSNNKRKYINGYWNGINIIGRCKSKNKIKFQKNSNFLMKAFPLSHEIFRHYYFFNTIEILDLVYYYFRKKISKKIFLKNLKNIKIPSKIKNQIKFRSQNIF
jgi:hypothetical protein